MGFWLVKEVTHRDTQSTSTQMASSFQFRRQGLKALCCKLGCRTLGWLGWPAVCSCVAAWGILGVRFQGGSRRLTFRPSSFSSSPLRQHALVMEHESRERTGATVNLWNLATPRRKPLGTCLAKTAHPVSNMDIDWRACTFSRATLRSSVPAVSARFRTSVYMNENLSAVKLRTGKILTP